MTAQEARIKAIWNSIPDVIRSKIQKIQYLAGCGLLDIYFYKSVAPEAFKDIDTTITKLQLLGYKVECDTVDISADLCSSDITADTKLTISW